MEGPHELLWDAVAAAAVERGLWGPGQRAFWVFLCSFFRIQGAGFPSQPLPRSTFLLVISVYSGRKKAQFPDGLLKGFSVNEAAGKRGENRNPVCSDSRHGQQS